MAGEEIRFSHEGKGVSFELGKKQKGEFEDEGVKNILNPIFDAILALGGDKNKLDTTQEASLLNKMKSIFSADGDPALSAGDVAVFSTFKPGDNVEAFINKAYEEHVRPKAPVLVEQGSIVPVHNNETIEGYEEEDVEDEEGNSMDIVKLTNPDNPDDVLYKIYVGPRSDIELVFNTLEEAEYAKSLNSPYSIIDAPEDETPEAKADRLSMNLDTLKQRIESSYNNIDVILDVIENLDSLYDTDSDLVSNANYTEFLVDLAKTKDATVIEKLMESDNLIKSSPELFKTVITILKEIRGKENNGERLTDNELNIKKLLLDKIVEFNGPDGMRYTSEGDVAFRGAFHLETETTIGTGYIYAQNKELMDDFLQEFLAEDADKKAVLLKYINDPRAKDDKSFLASLAWSSYLDNGPDFPSRDAEIASALIDVADAEVLSYLDLSYVEPEKLAGIEEQYVKKVKELYLGENKGDLANVRFLNDIIHKMYDFNAPFNDEENILDLINEFKKTYFDMTFDDSGAIETASFNPARRPTYEEMENLIELVGTGGPCTDALVDSIRYEDLGVGQYPAAIDNGFISCSRKFASFVENLSSPEDAIDFVKNKIMQSHTVPYDELLEKFPDSEELKLALFDKIDNNLYIDQMTSETFISILKSVINEEGSIDSAKLPDGITNKELGDKFLSMNVKYDDSDMPEGSMDVFKAFIKHLGKNDLFVIKRACHYVNNPSVVYDRVKTLVTENKTDNNFIQNVMDAFSEHVQCFRDILKIVDLNKLDIPTDAVHLQLATRMFDGYLSKQPLAKSEFDIALNNHWITPTTINTKSEHNKDTNTGDRYYTIGTNTYRLIDNGDTVKFEKVNPDGVQEGIDMFAEVKGRGDGNICERLKNNVNKDNVIDIIKAFNEQAKEYKDNGECIMRWLADEWGPSKDDMNHLPNALLEAAKEKGITESDPEYANLKNLIKTGSFWDYSASDADAIDEAMNALIAKLA